MSYDPCYICGKCAIKTNGEGKFVCSQHAFGEQLPLPNKAMRLQASVAVLAALGFASMPTMLMPKIKETKSSVRCPNCGTKCTGHQCRACHKILN